MTNTLQYKKGVYCLKFPNGKRYVGYTCKDGGFQARWSNHYAGSRYKNAKDYYSKKCKAIREFGWENVEKQIIVISDDIEYCKQLEVALIDAWKLNYKRHGDECVGVNGTDGGDGNSGFKHSFETIALMKLKKQGMSQVTKDRMSLSAKARVANIGAPMAGKNHTDSAKIKMKGKVRSAEWCRRLGEVNRGREPWNRGIPRTQEEKRKMQESHVKKQGKVITIRNIITNEEHTGCLRELARLYGINRRFIQLNRISKNYKMVDTTTSTLKEKTNGN